MKQRLVLCGNSVIALKLKRSLCGPSLWLLLTLAGLSGCANHKQIQQLQNAQLTQVEMFSHQQATLEEMQNHLHYIVVMQDEMSESIQKNSLHLSALSAKLPKKKVKKTKKKKVIKPPKDAPVNGNHLLAPEKMTIGRVEWLWLDFVEGYVKARIDTGAKSSSIHASDVQFFERDGNQWVRFTVVSHEKISATTSAQPQYELPVERTVKIRQASLEGLDKRPVVKLRIRVGEYEDDVEFTLANRKSMLYPVLLGRNFLKDIALVDVSRAFVQKRAKTVE